MWGNMEKINFETMSDQKLRQILKAVRERRVQAEAELAELKAREREHVMQMAEYGMPKNTILTMAEVAELTEVCSAYSINFADILKKTPGVVMIPATWTYPQAEARHWTGNDNWNITHGGTWWW